MSAVFADYSRYYDLLYADKDYAAEAEYVAALLRECRPRTRTIVEFGSGTGRHGGLLAQAGFDVVGIERSLAMLALSQARRPAGAAGSFRAVEGDVRTCHVPGTFDAVISLFHVVSYQAKNEDVLAMFRNAARHLASDGLFLFDVWYGPAVLTLRTETRVKRMTDSRIRVTRIAEPQLLADRNCVDVKYDVFIEELADGTIRQLSEQHRLRYFTTPEIQWLADLSGFQIALAHEWLTRREPSTNSWGVCYVLRRVAS
jgi:SAM-dependent methyltransferase